MSRKDRLVTMEGCKIPSPLNLNGNLAENFRKFKQNFLIYLKASGLDKKSEDVKVAILLNVIGEDSVELYNTFNLSEDSANEFKDVLKAFEEYTSPKKNIVIERFNFNSRSQDPCETFDNFVTDLRKLVKSCEYETQQDKVLRDRIVLGISDKSLQERLLRSSDLSLDKTIEFCRAAEAGRKQSEAIQCNKMVDTVRSGQPKYRPTNKSAVTTEFHSKQYNRARPNFNKPRPNESFVNRKPISWKKNLESDSKVYLCKKCNTKHCKYNCPAFGKKCHLCGKNNHFSVGCFKNKQRSSIGRINNIGLTNSETSEEDSFLINSLSTVRELSTSENRIEVMSSKEWIYPVYIEDKCINMKIDTGSEVNILPIDIIKKVNKRYKINPTNIVLEAYGGYKIKPIGMLNLQCYVNSNDCKYVNNDKNNYVPFVIVDPKNQNDKMKPILGLNASIKLGIVRNVNSIRESNVILPDDKDVFIKNNIDVFQGIGKFVGAKCNIKLKDNVVPIVESPRRIPLTVKSKLKLKLDQLEGQSIISKVDQPENFVSNLVIIEKTDGSIRICLDPKHLNKSIKREHFLIPTLEDLSAKLSNKCIFSVLDLKEGFYHIELDEQSTSYCTFNSPFGLYKFLRLPFGLVNSAEVFQKYNQANFGNIPNVVVYIDDLLIAADNVNDHDLALTRVLERARKLNVKFNFTKLQYRVEQVKFFGHVFEKNSMKPSPERVKDLLAIKNPSCKKELQRLLGMFNYLRRFVPNMAELTAPLRELLKNKADFIWNLYHSNVLEKLKTMISVAPALTNFDANKTLSIQCDSSKDGIGCCIMVNGQPMAFSSRSLTEPEKMFSQIEKEFLSIVYSVTRFHYYVYGRRVKVQTDCKPLVSIMNKNVSDIVSPRIQRMKVKLLKYDIELTYLPGKYMYIADLLSRSCNPSSDNDFDHNFVNELVHCVGSYTHVPIADAKKEIIKNETKTDVTLSKVINFVKSGWPNHKKQIGPDNNVKFYFNLRNDICEENGLLFYNNRVIIPRSLRKEMLTILHEGHFGVEKVKNRARQVIFWPGMMNDIDNLITKCSVCEKYRPNNVKEPMLSHEIPLLPFEKIAVDILDFAGNSYLVLVDYLSKWIELIELKSKSADEVISKLKTVFATHGIPKYVVSDNMPFNSFTCKMFAKQWNFQLVFSSPRYPKSNGLAERAVQTSKNILKKCKDDNIDLEIGLMDYRNLPIYNLGLSPAQILYSRRMRTKLPIHDNLLKPKLQHNVKEKLCDIRSKVKKYYDCTSRQRNEFYNEQNVAIRSDKVWEPATIIKKAEYPRSYYVRNKLGNVMRRNSFHIKNSSRPVNNQSCVDLDFDEDISESIFERPNTDDSGTQDEPVPRSPGIRTRYGRKIKPRSILDL